MNQPILLDMRYESTLRKRMTIAPALSLTPTTNADRTVVVVTHPPSAFCDDEFPLDSERIVASSLKRRRLDVPSSFPSAPGTLRRPPARRVRFASCATVTIIPSTTDIKTTCWYERKDYESFEIDCRQSIIAFLCRQNKKDETTSTPVMIATSGHTFTPQQQELPESRTHVDIDLLKNDGVILYSRAALEHQSPPLSQPPAPPETAAKHMTTVYFTIHGLDDFTSLEAKLLRTRRRLDHCYNVLYHQSVLQQQLLLRTGTRRKPDPPLGTNDRHHSTSRKENVATAISMTATEQAMVLQQIAQLSSFESKRLALVRGQNRDH